MSETVTMTLTEFLLARITEDEERVAGLRSGDGDPDFFWGPDRIRAECEAKRRIIRQHAGSDPSETGAHECPEGFMDFAETDPHTGWLRDCPTLRLLALPFADHPDYRQEWKP